MISHLSPPTKATLSLLLAACVQLGGCDESPSLDLGPGPINVVLIGLDTVRADHLGCYGNGEVQTPNLDAFAAEALLFENCSATSSWTLPSFASLFTSRMPSDHQAVGGAHKSLRADFPTLAEILGAHGYATRAHVAVDWLAPPLGLQRGFDAMSWEVTGATSGRYKRYQREVLGFLRQKPVEPHFLFVHYFDAHSPYDPPPPYGGMYYEGDRFAREETSLRVIYDPERNRIQRAPEQRYGWLAGVTDIQWPVKQYAADISYLDQAVGELLDGLRTTGLIERSIVVVLADHGEHLTEHDIYFTHRFPYQECLHVPFMIRLPAALRGGTRIADEISLLDLMPTLFELLGIEAEVEMEGKSLVPLLRGDGMPGRVLFAEYGANPKNHVRAAWDDRFRLLRFAVDGESWDEFYDRRVDREESQPLGDRFEGERRRLADLLERRFGPMDQILAGEAEPGGTEPDEEALERLRALGYID